jgi:hypothetical protein
MLGRLVLQPPSAGAAKHIHYCTGYLLRFFLEILHFFLEILSTFAGIFLSLLRSEYSFSVGGTFLT